MNAFKYSYQKLFSLGADTSEYYLLTKKHVNISEFEGQKIIRIEKEGLVEIARAAFRDVSFMLRTEHIKQIAAILNDTAAGQKDKFVAYTMLRNAEISAKGVLPFCQDTGTATIIGLKGQHIWTGYDDEDALSFGVFKTYSEENLRYSQVVPLNMFKEINTGNNLPAQIDINATEGEEYEFLFIAKGGGSANRTQLFQETKAILNAEKLEKFIIDKLKSLGASACPPYHIVFVIGGTSAEMCLKTVKLATTKYLDSLPEKGNEIGQAFRDTNLEEKILTIAYNMGIGAQFKGKYFALDIRIIRLPRHSASCPIGMGVSCIADRNIKAKINENGIWIEKLENNPGQYIPSKYRDNYDIEHVSIDLNRPIKETLALLSKYPVGTCLYLNGTIILARDSAHSKLKDHLYKEKSLPKYIKEHPVYYAGPAKTPKAMVSGSLGPTTANRMDSYVDLFQSYGGSLIMIGKGNRNPNVSEACKRNGGFYLASIGGPAAMLAQDSINKVELLEYPELGMEAIYSIEVKNFPSFIIIDDKGNNYYNTIN